MMDPDLHAAAIARAERAAMQTATVLRRLLHMFMMQDLADKVSK